MYKVVFLFVLTTLLHSTQSVRATRPKVIQFISKYRSNNDGEIWLLVK